MCMCVNSSESTGNGGRGCYMLYSYSYEKESTKRQNERKPHLMETVGRYRNKSLDSTLYKETLLYTNYCTYILTYTTASIVGGQMDIQDT